MEKEKRNLIYEKRIIKLLKKGDVDRAEHLRKFHIKNKKIQC